VPTTIAASSLPVKPDQTVPDWVEALTWMRYQLPPDAVVMSWWDYGYWITTIGNKTTLADNATLNATQIKRIGRMFMSNETEALKIIDEFNQLGRSRGFSSDVTHVVAFFTFDGQGNDVGYGEESKWRWMANIAFDSLDAWKDYGDFDEQGNWEDWNALGKSTIIYKFLQWGKKQRGIQVEATQPEHFELVYWSQKDKTTAVTAGGIHALVTVWKVKH